jgi:hypothetical protein
MNVSFRVSTRRTGQLATVRVVIYDNVEDLRAAAACYRGEPRAGFEDTQAVSQPRGTVMIEEDGTEWRKPACGVVRICREQGAGVLTHEMLHMGLAIYRWDMADAPLDEMKNEEVLAHLVSDLVTAANRKLWSLGVYAA